MKPRRPACRDASAQWKPQATRPLQGNLDIEWRKRTQKKLLAGFMVADAEANVIKHFEFLYELMNSAWCNVDHIWPNAPIFLGARRSACVVWQPSPALVCLPFCHSFDGNGSLV